MKVIAKYLDKYNHLLLRERIIVLVAFIVCLYFLYGWFLLNPIKSKSQTMQLEVNYLNSIQDQLAESDEFGGRSYSSELDLLKEKLTLLENHYAQLKNNESLQMLKSSNDVISIIEGLVTEIHAMKLTKIEALPTEYVSHNAGIADTEGPNNRTNFEIGKKVLNQESNINELDMPLISKHGIQVELKGSYSDLLAYLTKIESIDWHVYIDNIHFKVDRHPMAIIHILFYSFSFVEAENDF